MPAASEGLKDSSIGREHSTSPEQSAGWQVMDSGAIPATSTTKVVNFLVDSTPTTKKPCWQRPPPANAPPAEVVTLDDEEENGSDDDERCWTPVKISDVKVWTPPSTSSAPSRTSAVAALGTPQAAPVPDLPAAFVVDDSSTEEAAAVDLQSPNLCITKVGVFKWYFVVDGTRSDGNPKRRVIGYILADQPPEFLALWPEYAGLELVYNTRKDHYDKLKAEIANGKLLKDETEAEAKARLRESKLSFEKGIARIERFVLLTRKASAELRKALADGVPFNELFRRVSYKGETVKDPLRNDLYDWDEEVQVQRSTRYWYYYDKKLESIGVETYHCLFEGCQYAYVSVSKRRRRFEKSMCHTIDVERLHQHFLIHSEEVQNRAKRAPEEAAMNRSFTNNAPAFEQNSATSNEWNSSGFGFNSDATAQGNGFPSSGFGTSSFGASSSTGFGASESAAPTATSSGFASSGFGNGGFGGGGASDSSAGRSTTETWGSTSASFDFGTPAADSSTTASSGFANAGFGNGGFGAKQDTSAAARTDTDKPNSGFGIAAAGFGNSTFGNSSSTSGNFASTGFGSSATSSNNDGFASNGASSSFANSGSGNSGFGNSSTPAATKGTSNSGFGNAPCKGPASNSSSTGFANSGFGNGGYGGSGANSSGASGSFGFGGGNAASNDRGFGNTNNGSSAGGCRNCGQEGHFARECPEKKKSNGCRNCGEDGHFAKDCSKSRVPTCFNCEQKGHVSRNCPEPRKEGGYRGGHRGGGNSSFSSSANDSFGGGGGGGFGSSSFGGDSSGDFSNAPRGRFGNNRGGGNSRDGDSQSGFGSSGFGGGDGQGSSRGGFRMCWLYREEALNLPKSLSVVGGYRIPHKLTNASAPASSFGTAGFGNSSCGQPANADSKYKSGLSNSQSDDASRGRGANTEPLGKRRTFGGDDSSPCRPNAGASFTGFDASNGGNSNTSGGSFANVGFGNAGFGAPPSTNNSSTPSVTSSSGFGNSATKDFAGGFSSGGFGSSNLGASNQANSSTSAPEASAGFATSGFGQPASQPAKPAAGFGNAGFGAPSQPAASSASSSSAFGNASGFGNAGFGAPPTPNSSAVNSATEAHSEPPPKEINWDNTSSHDTTDSGPEPVVAAAPANTQGVLVPPPHIPPEIHQQWMHDMYMYRMHQMHMRARDPILRPNLLLKWAKLPPVTPTAAGTGPPSNSFAQDDGKKSDSTEAVNDAKDAGKETEKDAASAENKPTKPPDQETPADPYADELVRTALASIPMLETEEQKAQKRKERAQSILLPLENQSNFGNHLKTKVEQLKFDDENLFAKFGEVDQRRNAVQKTEQRRDRFAELARQKPAELRELLSQGASINEVFLQMGTGRGDMLLEELIDSEEDREAEKKKNKKQESSQPAQETKDEEDDDLKWTEIDPEVFFERTELKGGTFRFTCKVDECGYKYSPSAKLLPETMLARLRQHFTEKHTASEFPQQAATIEPVDEVPSTSKGHNLDVDLSSFPETSIELQALYKLDVLEYKQFFELNDAGTYKCLFVDCDYAFKSTSSVKDPSYQLKRHCASFHF